MRVTFDGHMRTLFATLLIFLGLSLNAQDSLPTSYFSSPVDFPIVLAGNFGEIRGGHFHAGIDIKTQQVEGKSIKAAADGYVARIKISLYGYGKVLYIKHPNGYTTVYAHLQQFNDKIEAYTRARQYEKESFTIELFPQPGELPVKRGEEIALSGNTGGSGGPHLHFEIRKSVTEVPVNPLLFDFNVVDRVSPQLKTLAVYPLNDISSVNGTNQPLYLNLVKEKGRYWVPYQSKIEVSGKIGFGLEAIDKLNGAPNRCGVYSITLQKNGKTVYHHEMDGIPFPETRYINAHVDYDAWNRNTQRVQRSFLLPHNNLSIYKNLVNKGHLFFLQDTTYQMQYDVYDAHENYSYLKFEVKSKKLDTLFKRPKEDSLLFALDKTNTFKRSDIKVTIPPFALYEDLYFRYEKKPAIATSIAPVHVIQDLYTPLHQYMNVSLQLDSTYLPKANKVYMVSLDEKLEVLAPEGGTFERGFIKTRTRSFGPYTLMIDTIPPTIKPLNIYQNKNMAGEKSIRFKISDDESGISSYEGRIDGKWELFEFDKKTGIIFFAFPPNYPKGNHKAEITVADDRRNTVTQSFTFVR